MKQCQLAIKQLHRQVNGDLKKARLFSENERILLACSGGPDSMVLLEVLRALSVHRKAHWTIGVATMNHSIRPEGEEELRMVEAYCKQEQLPFYGITMDIPTLAKENACSLETMGREARYQWLLDVATRENYSFIAVAHHKDDQGETILAHLIRGAGAKGLTGMDMLQNSYHIPIVRPLLGVRKSEILEYAQLRQIPYCIDDSNNDVLYTRNRIRHQIMPVLEGINSNVVDALCRLGSIIQEDVDFIEDQAQCKYEELVTDSNSQKCLSRKALCSQPKALQRRIWQLLCTPIQLSWAHQQQLDYIVNSGEPKTLTIHHITIIAQCDTIQVYCKD